MTYKIVSDSSSNLFHMENTEYAYVPLKILTDEKEYVDSPELDLNQMIEELKEYKGKSGTSCPNVYDWLHAFGDADMIFGVAITSNLSGCFSASQQAKAEYEQTHKGAKVFILDSLSTGPEMQLILEKMRELTAGDFEFEDVKSKIQAYKKHTHLLFSLESLDNMARNGRVKPTVAKLAGLLGIRIVGKASEEGTLQPLHKCRGEKGALQKIIEGMKKEGFHGGKVRIAHCMNENAAKSLKEHIIKEFPNSNIEIGICTGLCSFYAEKGGVLVGYES